MQVPMASKFLPEDRRDIQQYMVDNSVANIFVIGVKLGLFSKDTVDRIAMIDFSKALFKLVARRHTHLWT